MICEPKSQNGLQNDQKSIRFIDKTHMASRQVANLYKPCRNEDVWEALAAQPSLGRPVSRPALVARQNIFPLQTFFCTAQCKNVSYGVVS